MKQMKLKTIIKKCYARNYITKYQYCDMMLDGVEITHKENGDKYYIPRKDITQGLIDYFEKHIDNYEVIDN